MRECSCLSGALKGEARRGLYPMYHPRLTDAQLTVIALDRLSVLPAVSELAVT